MKKIITYIIVLILLSNTAYAYSGESLSLGHRIVKEAAHWLGSPYGISDGSDGYGTEIDCSGLVMQVYGAFGIQLPRTSMLQAMEGKQIPLNQMIPGDIVCFRYEDGSIGHVGIYAGGNTMIHSPRFGKTVELTSNFEDWGTIKAVYGVRIDAPSDYVPATLTDEIEAKISDLTNTHNFVTTTHLLKDNKILKLTIDSPVINVNGEDKLIDRYGEISPLIINGRTLLPLRCVAEEFGAEVVWIGGDNGEISVKYKNTEITMWIGTNMISVNGNIKYIDVPPYLINGSSFLPIRLIADEFGWKVEWDGENKSITLTRDAN